MPIHLDLFGYSPAPDSRWSSATGQVLLGMVMAEGTAKFKRELPKPHRPAGSDRKPPEQAESKKRDRLAKIGGYFVR